MIHYLDSSVVLRRILGQPQPFTKWTEVEVAVSSELLFVECSRVLDRMRQAGAISSAGLVSARESLGVILSQVSLLTVSRAVLDRAASAFPLPIGTLDALHLASALLWQELRKDKVVVLTHDRQLYLNARAMDILAQGIDIVD